MRFYFLVLFLLVLVTTASAQHTHQHSADTIQRPTAKDTVPAHPAGHDHAAPQTPAHDHPASAKAAGGHSHADEGMMSYAFSRHLPMTRTGSGTAWLPDNSPIYGYMFHTPTWMYMLHGDVYLRYNKQDLLNRGSRGGHQWDAPNMVMFMGQRPVGAKGLFHFNTMLSLDPMTVGGDGYPLLFQTGESYKGRPLVDRQHPHDLFSELSVSYAHAFTPKTDLFLYLGYPGEPALGPAAYVHRPSGFFNPDAPLTHHWVDATHITFGVATIGFRQGRWKAEASSFTGREPDEHRYDFDKPRFDSWSGRLSFNPSRKWALQASHAFIKEPEALHPGEDVNRTTASATYSSRGFGEQFTNVTALWGMNKTKGHDSENGFLLEGAHSVKRTTVYSRYEWVQKSVEELALNEVLFGHDAVFPVHAVTVGTSYDLLLIGQTKVALGGQLSLYAPDKRLTLVYGDTPLAGQMYLRLYPRAAGKQTGRFYLPL